jgi:hypothetical protein
MPEGICPLCLDVKHKKLHKCPFRRHSNRTLLPWNSPLRPIRGGYLLTPYDSGFEEKMAKADDIISRHRNTRHVLAK